MPFVIDASVALSWCFEDETSAYADAVLRRLRDESGVAQILWHMEIVNVLVLANRSGRLTDEKLEHGIRLIKSLPVRVEDMSAPEIQSRVLETARTHRLTVYDASYLYIAMREGLSLATLDVELIEAAPKAGVEILQP